MIRCKHILLVVSLLSIITLSVSQLHSNKHAAEDNEFAEFEDPDDVSTIDLSHKPGKKHVEDPPSSHPSKESKKSKPQPPPTPPAASPPVEVQDNQADPDQTEPGESDGGDAVHSDSSGQAETGEQAGQPDARQESAEMKKDDDDDSGVTVEAEEEDMSHLTDTEEFEGFDRDRLSAAGVGKKDGKPDLKIAKVPHHLTTSWENFYLEMLMLAGLLVYLFNFLIGKAKNARLANAWFTSHKELLEANFSIVGDDGQAQSNTGALNKESEHIYSLWCSGRVCCEGMLVELKLLKRQDLVSVIARWFKPTYDQITVKVFMDEADMDGFVMAIASRKRVGALLKDYTDLATFCPEKKSVTKMGLPDSFVLLGEIGEATSAMVDAKMGKLFTDFEDFIEFIHFSDQYTGPRAQQEEGQTTKLPEIKKALVFCFKVGHKGGKTNVGDMEAVKPLLKLVFYMMDKVKRFKLSKEAKLKSDKNRQRAMDSYQKLVHSQRQEAAQQRREEKRRQEKERLMSEEDPDKARKMEERDQKRELKRKQPKMKMLKVKGM